MVGCLCCFNLHFADVIQCAASLYRFFVCYLYIFGEMSAKVFGLFFTLVVCFLIVEFLFVCFFAALGSM